MSAGKNRQTCRSYPPSQNHPPSQSYPICQTYQSHRLPVNAAVISAVARADVACAPHRSLGLGRLIGAAPGCRATPGAGGGAETPGVGAR